MPVASTVLSEIFYRKLAAFAGYTFLLYDYLLTLPQEVAYIWDGPWSVVKVLFLMNRYWTLLGQTFIALEETGYLSHSSERFCEAFELYLPFFAILSGESIRLLVAIRACAILRLKPVVSTTWSILYILYALIILGVVFYFFTHAGPPNFQHLDETGICISPTPPNLWTILFITLLLDSFILFIVFYSLHRMIRGVRGIFPSRLVRLLARDATLFYIGTLFNSLLCLICWTVWGHGPRNVLQQWISVPYVAVVGQRVVLNLRKHRARQGSTRDLSRQVDRQVAALSLDGERTDPLTETGFESYQLSEL